MKVDYKTVQKRRDDIMMLIQKMGRISVKQLLHEFNVSEITLRRDLQYWEERGAIVRYHGGAKIVQHMVNHDNSNFTNDRYKHAIAKKAASFVKEGDIVFINTSSTALLILSYLNKRCTVITNNAKAAFTKHQDCVSIVLTGGELRFPKEAMVGDFVLNNLAHTMATKCFLGCSGIEADYGVSSAIMNETAVNKKMIQQTRGDVYIVCDYTKVGNKHSFVYSPIEQIDGLITDINANPTTLENLAAKGLEIITLQPIPVIRNE